MDARLDIFCKLERYINKKSGKLIGINGVDTSGKTQFAKYFNEYLLNKGYKTQLISIDDFHNPRSIRQMGSNMADSYFDNAFNLTQLEKAILAPIKADKVIDMTLKLLDLDTDEYTLEKKYIVHEDTIVLLEGVLLYREPIDKYFDIRIFLDITFEEVLKRAEQRDVPKQGADILERYKNRYIPVQKRYIDECKPIEKSDFIIDNNDYNTPKLIFNK